MADKPKPKPKVKRIVVFENLSAAERALRPPIPPPYPGHATDRKRRARRH